MVKLNIVWMKDAEEICRRADTEGENGKLSVCREAFRLKDRIRTKLWKATGKAWAPKEQCPTP